MSSKTNTEPFKTNTEQLQEEIKQTADSAVALARNTAEAVQKDVQAASAEIKDNVQQVFLAGLGAFALAEEEGSKLFKKLVKKGEKVELKGLATEPLKTLRGQLDVNSAKVGLAVKERVGDAQFMANEAAEKVEDRVQDAVAVVMKRVGVPTRTEISELTASVERLTQHIERMKQERAEAPAVVVAPPALSFEGVGGGWYEIRVGSVVVEKVQGREEAEAALVRLQAQQN